MPELGRRRAQQLDTATRQKLMELAAEYDDIETAIRVRMHIILRRHGLQIKEIVDRILNEHWSKIHDPNIPASMEPE